MAWQGGGATPRRNPVHPAAKLEHLLDPASYPHPTRRVDMVETHMSWVFLTDHYAYKLLKPIRLPFLDFRTRAKRRRNCEQSLRLNRRLARDVYLDVLALRADAAGRLSLIGPGESVDWLVWMRRVPEDAMLHRLIERGGPTADALHRCARLLAEFYRRAEPIALRPTRYVARFRQGIAVNYAELSRPEFALMPEQVEFCRRVSLEALRELAPLLKARAGARRIIEAHGDLRPEHICLLPEPVIIDCLEFDRELRLLDPLDELAYLDIECELLGAPSVGPAFFDAYLAESGDEAPPQLVDFYRLYRTLMRARIAAWHIHDYPANEHPKWLAQAGDYLALAGVYAARLARREAPL
jgi:uncharacterized protein